MTRAKLSVPALREALAGPKHRFRRIHSIDIEQESNGRWFARDWEGRLAVWFIQERPAYWRWESADGKKKSGYHLDSLYDAVGAWKRDEGHY